MNSKNISQDPLQDDIDKTLKTFHKRRLTEPQGQFKFTFSNKNSILDSVKHKPAQSSTKI